MKYDLIIIGAGPGGYTAALRARRLKQNVLLIDKRSEAGGTCLHVGCIPSKTLLEASGIYAKVRELGPKIGIRVEEHLLDFSQMMAMKQEVVSGLAHGVTQLLKQQGVEMVAGSAQVISPHEVEVQGVTYSTENILVATGSKPIALPGLPIDEERVVSSTGALCLKTLPKKLVVIGAGVIGCELASVYRRLGSQVEVLDIKDQILYPMDPHVSRTLHRELKRQGIVFHLQEAVESTKVCAEHIEIQTDKSVYQADVVLVSIGRKPHWKGLGLEELGVQETPQGFIEINENFQTHVPSIYACGDVIEGPLLAHRASQEALAIAESLAGLTPTLHYSLIPNVIYTDPEVATVGLSEEQARQHQIEPLVATSFIRANPRARASLHQEGFVKILAHPSTRQILGMHIIAPHASELIAIGVTALAANMTLDTMAKLPFAHPTLSESIQEAAASL